MAPKRSQASRRRAASPRASSDLELEVDASWADISELPTPPDHYHRYAPPRCFFDEMVQDRDHWAAGLAATVDGGDSCFSAGSMGIVRTIVRAIQVSCVPWHADWAHWRRHASEFFGRLCSHRASSQRKNYFLEQRIGILEKKVIAIQDNERVSHNKIAAMEGAIGRLVNMLPSVGSIESPRGRGSCFSAEQDLASAQRSGSVQDLIARAQLRAVASRSPEPRREIARLSREFERDDLGLP